MDYGCQQVLIQDRKLVALLEYLCQQSNKVYNCALYYARQVYFKTKRLVSYAQLCREMVRTKNKHFAAMYASSAQQTCKSVAEALTSFKSLLQAQPNAKPRLPHYRKAGLFPVAYPKQWLKFQEGQVRVPLGKQVKAWFGLDAFWVQFPTHLRWEDLKELRILPRHGVFYLEWVYAKPSQPQPLDPTKALAIDHGVDNWLACVSNLGHSFIIDGRKVKSFNQWYNKEVARLRTNKPQGFWSRRLSCLTEKRNRRMRDAVNKAARLVVNSCLEHSIGKVIFGWNKGQKQACNLGKVNNQSFVFIPTERLKRRIEELCQQYGIEFIEVDEAYSSQASFLDGDELPNYGEKPDGWQASGKRVKRGLYQTATGWLVNADANAAANLLKKVSRTLGLCLKELSRGVLTTPLRVRLWTA
ncbi:RNA-guided endonuclease InsQ/TnpB family protein [Synechococcus sp. H55.10]